MRDGEITLKGGGAKWYGLGRSILEPMRISYWQFWGFPVASLIGLILVFVTIILIVSREKVNEWKIHSN